MKALERLMVQGWDLVWARVRDYLDQYRRARMRSAPALGRSEFGRFVRG